jgi:hypothetical protein
MNIQSCKSEKAVYRSFGKQTETQNNEIPVSTEAETFWLKLWIDERTSLKLTRMREGARTADTQKNVSKVELGFCGKLCLSENVSGPENAELRRM